MRFANNNFHNINQKVRELEDDRLRNQHMKELHSEHEQSIELKKKSVREIFVGILFAIIMSIIDYCIATFQPIGWIKTLAIVLIFISGIGALQFFFGVYGLISTMFNKSK